MAANRGMRKGRNNVRQINSPDVYKSSKRSSITTILSSSSVNGGAFRSASKGE